MPDCIDLERNRYYTDLEKEIKQLKAQNEELLAENEELKKLNKTHMSKNSDKDEKGYQNLSQTLMTQRSTSSCCQHQTTEPHVPKLLRDEEFAFKTLPNKIMLKPQEGKFIPPNCNLVTYTMLEQAKEPIGPFGYERVKYIKE